jgi:hypothetical protein
MTDTKKKTTLNIPPTEMRPFYDLAQALGYWWGGRGNISELVRHIMRLVRATDADTVAAALSSERLAEVAEGMQEADDDANLP